MHTSQVCRDQTHHLLQASRTIRQSRAVLLERDHICQGRCDIDIVLHKAPTPCFKHAQGYGGTQTMGQEMAGGAVGFHRP